MTDRLPDILESVTVSSFQYERLKSELSEPTSPMAKFCGLPIYCSQAMPDGWLGVVEPPKGPGDRRPAWERFTLFRFARDTD